MDWAAVLVKQPSEIFIGKSSRAIQLRLFVIEKLELNITSSLCKVQSNAVKLTWGNSMRVCNLIESNWSAFTLHFRKWEFSTGIIHVKSSIGCNAFTCSEPSRQRKVYTLWHNSLLISGLPSCRFVFKYSAYNDNPCFLIVNCYRTVWLETFWGVEIITWYDDAVADVCSRTSYSIDIIHRRRRHTVVDWLGSDDPSSTIPLRIGGNGPKSKYVWFRTAARTVSW